MAPDFDRCGADFLQNAYGKYSKYVYRGPVHHGLSSASSPLITLQGCKELCGPGVAYYPYVHPPLCPVALLI